eukprot:5531359-Pyramimonas_sp.AAC.1
MRPSPELRRMWKHAKAARLGRLAYQLAGARQAGVHAWRLIDEWEITECRINRTIEPIERINIYREDLDV